AQEVNHMIIFFLVSLQFSLMDASVGELGKKGHQSLLLLNELSQHAALLGNIGSLYNERSKEDPETGYDWMFRMSPECLLKNEHEKYLLILVLHCITSFHAHDGDQEIEGENEMNNFMLFLLHTNSFYFSFSACSITSIVDFNMVALHFAVQTFITAMAVVLAVFFKNKQTDVPG
ncbi:hypothetical protein ACJX0J_018864, partial [Zea mays]